jgi:hypothetical protein
MYISTVCKLIAIVVILSFDEGASSGIYLSTELILLSLHSFSDLAAVKLRLLQVSQGTVLPGLSQARHAPDQQTILDLPRKKENLPQQGEFLYFFTSHVKSKH